MTMTPRFFPRTMAVAVVGILSGVIIGCSDSHPTGPRLQAIAPSFSTATYWDKETFFNSHTFFVPCAGEDMRFYGWVPYQYHEVDNSAGGFDYHLQYRAGTPNDPPFVAEGQTTGKIYYAQNGHPIDISFHAAAGEVTTVVDRREIYIAGDGSQLHLLSGLHMTVNANGTLTVDDEVPFSVECTSP